MEQKLLHIGVGRIEEFRAIEVGIGGIGAREVHLVDQALLKT